MADFALSLSFREKLAVLARQRVAEIRNVLRENGL